MGNNILEIQNLTKYYGKTKGVENLSLKLEEGRNIWIYWTKWSRKINDYSFNYWFNQ